MTSIDNNDINQDQDYIEIPVTLKLKKNIAEVANMLSICYSDSNTRNNDIFNEFISKQVTRIIYSLAEDLPEPPTLPESFRQHIKRLIKGEEDPK